MAVKRRKGDLVTLPCSRPPVQFSVCTELDDSYIDSNRFLCLLDYTKLEENRYCLDDIENMSCFNVTAI